MQIKTSGRIFLLMGKSSSGKDTIYQRLLNDESLDLKKVIPYTTRPMREGEQEGVEYHFVTEEEFNDLQYDGKIIEARSYNTVHGIWRYFTVEDYQMNDTHQDYIMIGTLQSYQSLREFFWDEKIVPIYIHVEDGVRLQRALDREKTQKDPKYAEMCRRFLADEEDFSEENLTKAGIILRWTNNNLDETVGHIRDYIWYKKRKEN